LSPSEKQGWHDKQRGVCSPLRPAPSIALEHHAVACTFQACSNANGEEQCKRRGIDLAREPPPASRGLFELQCAERPPHVSQAAQTLVPKQRIGVVVRTLNFAID
jgi:hypothetical protein